jgi:hypothetical protein
MIRVVLDTSVTPATSATSPNAGKLLGQSTPKNSSICSAPKLVRPPSDVQPFVTLIFVSLLGRSSSSSTKVSIDTPEALAYSRSTGRGGSRLPRSYAEMKSRLNGKVIVDEEDRDLAALAARPRLQPQQLIDHALV